MWLSQPGGLAQGDQEGPGRGAPMSGTLDGCAPQLRTPGSCSWLLPTDQHLLLASRSRQAHTRQEASSESASGLRNDFRQTTEQGGTNPAVGKEVGTTACVTVCSAPRPGGGSVSARRTVGFRAQTSRRQTAAPPHQRGLWAVPAAVLSLLPRLLCSGGGGEPAQVPARHGTGSPGRPTSPRSLVLGRRGKELAAAG